MIKLHSVNGRPIIWYCDNNQCGRHWSVACRPEGDIPKVCECESGKLEDVQYPLGTDLLFMAHYRSERHTGDMNGADSKLSGTFEEAVAEAQTIAIKEGFVVQCIRRRY
jgi:hypothetical protein